LDIKSVSWKNWHNPDGDGHAGLATVTFTIGEAGSNGADLFEGMIVAAPLGLAKMCEEEGFVWGRQTIVVDTFRRDETREMVLNFVKDYLGNARGPIHERFSHAAQLARWEHEDIDVLFDHTAQLAESENRDRVGFHGGSSKPITEARLVELSSPDCDLAVGPANHRDFSVRIHARVGATGSCDNAVYEILLCTPNRVAAMRDLRQVTLFDGFAFVHSFDLAMEQEIRDVCADLKGYSSGEAIAKFARYARRLTPTSTVNS
jgi:hypothetical protein